MMRRLLNMLGWTIEYQDHRGVYEHRYDSLDFAMCRPIHYDMPVAFPTAKRIFRRL